MARQRTRDALSSFKQALATPTIKQKEAYGRLAHTLCAACCVGAVSVTFGRGTFSSWSSRGWCYSLQAPSLAKENEMPIAFFVLGTLICVGFVYLATRETGSSRAKTEHKERHPA